MEQRIGIERLEQAVNLFGSFDENIRMIESEFSVTVSNREGDLRVNGDVERKHTCGAFIKPVPHADPSLTIYLDSRSRVVDFNANRELYLQRLAYGGLPLSRIEFRLAKDIPARSSADEEAEERELPELSDEELELVRAATANLAEPLKSSVSKAMIASMRREKAFPS